MTSVRQKIEEWSFEKHIPWLHFLFMKIAEPRVRRLVYFGIYLCMIVASWGVFTKAPPAFENTVGQGFVMVLAAFMLLGASLGAFAVLPGIWWLERAGIIALTTAMGMYVIIISAAGVASQTGFAIVIAFSLTFSLRWIDIKDFLVAPEQG